MNAAQKAESDKNVPLEVKQGVKHTFGVLSMGRYDDPDSGGSSFSVLLGDAPHLDTTALHEYFHAFGMAAAWERERRFAS